MSLSPASPFPGLHFSCDQTTFPGSPSADLMLCNMLSKLMSFARQVDIRASYFSSIPMQSLQTCCGFRSPGSIFRGTSLLTSWKIGFSSLHSPDECMLWSFFPRVPQNLQRLLSNTICRPDHILFHRTTDYGEISRSHRIGIKCDFRKALNSHFSLLINFFVILFMRKKIDFSVLEEVLKTFFRTNLPLTFRRQFSPHVALFIIYIFSLHGTRIMNILRNNFQKLRIPPYYEFNDVFVFRRSYTGKKAKKQEKAIEKALKHFDDFYHGIFRQKWHSIRLGLLSRPKHVALLNNFADIDETKEVLKLQGALDLRKLIIPEESDLISNEIHEETDSDTHVLSTTEEQETDESEKDDENIDSILKSYAVDSLEEELDGECRDSTLSLHEALQQSQIDTSRFIDPSSEHELGSLHEFIPVTDLKGNEEFIPESDYYRFYKVNSDIPVNIEKEYDLVFPDNLQVYSYPRGDISLFPFPRNSKTGVMNYYPLDGASILVVLALDLQLGDTVLDMCAAPGGKSLMLLQTMLARHVVCNDSSASRLKRLAKVLRSYLIDYPEKWNDIVSLSKIPGESFSSNNEFNKILVDVPCTCDRKSVIVNENNIFKTMRIKERLALPEYQTDLLERALTIVSPGGTVVYSTCSLSPIQNDGVVNSALNNLWSKYNMEFTIKDLSPALKKMSHFYKFSFDSGIKYGSLVVPFVPVNFGPMYFCKIVKNK
ncbi:UNVERIFIED_CONTAM: hypothetical protein PYX00_003012 [Menopon gallinae]|uniref:NOL1/NOP2/Sun domain family member 4 n=1 Tax=Menopon gallinae TaxID=328185 RepID=A0AAW2HZT1_9NEOP